MTTEELSKNEKLTLYGLVRFPGVNDRLLSDEIKLKMSTVTAIRNRLKRDGYFRTVRVPYLDRLGGELLVVTYIRLNVLKPREELLKALREVLATMDDVFFAFADLSQLITFSLCRNYTDAWTDSEKGHQLLSEKGVAGPRFSRRHTLLFPLNQTKLLRFFDFSKILNQRYGLEYPEPDVQFSLKPEKLEQRHLSRIEKRVYHGLVKYPELVDNEVARKIGVTRQSVTKIRKRFESERLLATMRIPDIQKIGAEILGIAYYESAANVTMVSRKKGMEWVVKEMPSFFHIAGHREGVLMGLAANYSDFQRRQYEVSRMYLERGYFKDEPFLATISVPDLSVVKDFTFAPVVKKVLDIKDDK